MPDKKLYKVKKAGYYLGSYIAEGKEVMMFPKQAKYGLMNGQLVDVSAKKAFKEAPKKAMPAPKKSSEYSRKRGGKYSVGGSFGGSVG